MSVEESFMVFPGFLHIVKLELHCLEYLYFLFTVFGPLYVTNCLLGTRGNKGSRVPGDLQVSSSIVEFHENFHSGF